MILAASNKRLECICNINTFNAMKKITEGEDREAILINCRRSKSLVVGVTWDIDKDDDDYGDHDDDDYVYDSVDSNEVEQACD